MKLITLLLHVFTIIGSLEAAASHTYNPMMVYLLGLCAGVASTMLVYDLATLLGLNEYLK